VEKQAPCPCSTHSSTVSHYLLCSSSSRHAVRAVSSAAVAASPMTVPRSAASWIIWACQIWGCTQKVWSELQAGSPAASRQAVELHCLAAHCCVLEPVGTHNRTLRFCQDADTKPHMPLQQPACMPCSAYMHTPCTGHRLPAASLQHLTCEQHRREPPHLAARCDPCKPPKPLRKNQ
jgi:hypothetical protein